MFLRGTWFVAQQLACALSISYSPCFLLNVRVRRADDSCRLWMRIGRWSMRRTISLLNTETLLTILKISTTASCLETLHGNYSDTTKSNFQEHLIGDKCDGQSSSPSPQ